MSHQITVDYPEELPDELQTIREAFEQEAKLATVTPTALDPRTLGIVIVDLMREERSHHISNRETDYAG